jgi:hypothetical protein
MFFTWALAHKYPNIALFSDYKVHEWFGVFGHSQIAFAFCMLA